jgi:hypothetical protein
MLKFRIQLIECVLNSANSKKVERAILEVIDKEIKRGVSVKKIARIVSSLENDMYYQMRLVDTRQELSNLREALKVLKKGIVLDD